MMSKRKVFPRAEVKRSEIRTTQSDKSGQPQILDDLPPNITLVNFPEDPAGGVRRSYDFGRWYGSGIDPIVFICQRQIERFFDSPDSPRSLRTIITYCDSALPQFFRYCIFSAKAKGSDLNLTDINRDFIDGFLTFLRNTGIGVTSQRTLFKNTKSVLVALGRRGILKITDHGDEATFPKNPFPHINKRYEGEKPLCVSQRKAVTQALKTAVTPLLSGNAEPTAKLLSYAVLLIALYTGRNTTSLLELTINCLRPHPKKGVQLLVVDKRRGRGLEGVPVTTRAEGAVWKGTARLVERTIELTSKFRGSAPAGLAQRLWLYRLQTGTKFKRGGTVTAINEAILGKAVKDLVVDFNLVDNDGRPLRLNVSTLRKTFSNRVFEIVEGDLAVAAEAAGHTPKVAGDHYMVPGEHAKRNWRFMGQALHVELLSGSVGATEKTPTGRCSDPLEGQFAPKNGAACMNFLDCLRCRNYVVTGDDLYRVLSFYWLIVRERQRIGRKRWQRAYAHIIRMIDKDVLEAGIKRRVFTRALVTAERERAYSTPHPFWADSAQLEAFP